MVICKHMIMESGENEGDSSEGQTVIDMLRELLMEKQKHGGKNVIRNSFILPTLPNVSETVMECSTAAMNMHSGSRLCKRCMWSVQMGWGGEWKCI